MSGATLFGELAPTFKPSRVEVPPGASDEFYTPRQKFERFGKRFGPFTVDACATRESAKVARFYDLAADGLAQNYEGEDVWNNPPYSDIAPWVTLADHWIRVLGPHGARSWTMLPPANRTEQPWWQDFVEPYRDLAEDQIRYEDDDGNPLVVICPPRGFTLETSFVRGRIAFGFPGDPDGLKSEGGKFASVVLHWRNLTRR